MKKSPAEIMEMPVAHSRTDALKISTEDQEDMFIEALERYLRRTVVDENSRMPRWAWGG